MLSLQRDIQAVYDIHDVRAGQRYWIEVIDGLFQRFIYAADTQHWLAVERRGQTFYISLFFYVSMLWKPGTSCPDLPIACHPNSSLKRTNSWP